MELRRPTSKISIKNQITLPKKVREAIGVYPGDKIFYEIDGDVVRIMRLDPFDAEFHNAITDIFSEWASAEDEVAFSAI